MTPFLKWPGSKRWVIDEIRAQLPAGRRLVEPFIGSAAVASALDYDAYLLADSNPDLINLYTYLADGGTDFIDACATYFTPEYNEADAYYEMRADFNAETDSYNRAVWMVYLNRHCFNGLWRMNQSGKFNSPFGRYKRPYFPKKEMEDFYTFLIEKKPTLRCQTFQETFAQLQSGDVVYADPPYVPLSKTASFTAYGSAGFGPSEQAELVALSERAKNAGIPVVISNADTPATRDLYSGGTIYSFDAPRRIAAKGKSRGNAREVLATYAPTS